MIDKELHNLSDRETKRKLLSAIAPLQGLFEISIMPRRMTRRIRANAYHWACVVEPFRQFLAAQGQHVSKLQCHDMLKIKCLPQDVFDPNSGELIATVPGESHTLNIPEFSAFETRCIEWLSDMFGIICPQPDSFMEEPCAKDTE